MRQIAPVMALAASLLCGDALATLSPGTGWTYKTGTDKMDSSVTKYADILSDNTMNLAFPYNGDNRGHLMVRQEKSSGLNVIFQIRKGQIICDSYRGCQVSVRFDDAPPVTFSGSGSTDHDSTVMFIKPEGKFVDLAKRAKQIRVAVTIYQAGQ